jgi:hypothetical protein
MLAGRIDLEVIERAAVAIYEFDEDATDWEAREEGFLLGTARLSWIELCATDAPLADAYRGRARAALLAVLAEAAMTSNSTSDF